MKDENLLEKIIEKETIFEGKIFDTQLWTVELPNGQKALREATLHPGGVSAFVLCNDGTVPLVRQHRVVAGEVLWELPAGKIEKGEDTLEAIKRELEEEVGLRANHWEKMVGFFPTAAYCSEMIHLFFAKDTIKTQQCLDPDEFLQVAFFSVEQLLNMACSGEIKDGKTLIGIFLALNRIEKRGK